MPLYSVHQEGADLGNDVRGKSELPTWLESLRVNERPNLPASEQSYFPMADLYEDGTLPSWMRPENAEMLEKGKSGPYPAWRPASMSAPHTDENIIPSEGISARSLIDEQSLPSWVQGNQQNPQSTTGSTPVTPDSQRNFSAASLIQPDQLPDWMQSMPQASQSSASQNTVWGGEQPGASQVRINSYTSDPANVNTYPQPQPFSAPELADPQAITHMFTGQTGQQAGYPSRTTPQVQSGLPASSLLDENSLPTWIREEEQMPGQPGQRPAYTSRQSGQPSSENHGLSGASLIDANALPGWLTSYEAQQQAGLQSTGNARSLPTIGTSPRGESVRVPSRPRSEITSHEQSEVAANVFSSMLGVASTAPYFPSTGSSQNVSDPSQGMPVGQPQAPAGTQWNAPSQSSGFAGAPPVHAFNPAANQMGQPGASPPGGYPGYVSPGSPPMTALPGTTQSPPVNGPGMPVDLAATGKPGTNASSSKKRGFIETIRSWFS
jgi:hypothetical protein